MPTNSNEPMAPAGFFTTSSQVAILGGHFIQNNIRGSNDRHAEDHMIELYHEVSPNAILNTGGRLDTAICYPGTRKEVIERMDRWMGSGYRADHRILWLSGPAGAGKSAIVQTVAELWRGREIPLASFFFFRADPSRNHIRAVVATLLYQMLALYPDLKDRVNSIMANDPLILRQSIHIQFKKLIQEPIDFIRRRLPPFQPPIILLVDGLDECDSGAQAKEDQRCLLRLLNDLVTAQESPFIALVASRPEPHLIMAFNEIGTFRRSIFLDASYRPDADIRRFIASELGSIKRTHYLGHSLTKDWPSQAIISSIVEKSSGQFIYAATVIRFIRNSSASPAISMHSILGLRPIKSISPFVELDAMYTHILTQAHDWDAVRDILATYRMLTLPWGQTMSDVVCGLPDLLPRHAILSALGYSWDDVESSLSDLTSVVRLDSYSSEYYSSLHYHHASLGDFLYNQIRAGKLYIDLNFVACRIVAGLCTRNPEISSVLGLMVYFLDYVTEPDIMLNNALQNVRSLYYSTGSTLHPWQMAPLAWHFFDRVDEVDRQFRRNSNSEIGI